MESIRLDPVFNSLKMAASYTASGSSSSYDLASSVEYGSIGIRSGSGNLCSKRSDAIAQLSESILQRHLLVFIHASAYSYECDSSLIDSKSSVCRSTHKSSCA